MSSLDFLKLHGLGNDFILIDEREGERVPEASKPSFAARSCDRHMGVGADGVLFLGPHEGGVSFRILNSDGSEAEMCVNGIRCAALALRLRLDPEAPDETCILTPGGLVKTRVLSLDSGIGGMVEVETYFDPKYQGTKKIPVGGTQFEWHLVNVGNPHAVTFLEQDLEDLDVEGIGHALEHHDEFQPEGVNAEFVNQTGPGALRMRVHERGACETMACGSGAIASATAARQLDPSQGEFEVTMLGGPLQIEFGDKTIVRGPAALVFEGVLLV
jgi:diaminopimelate epimerase